MSYTIFRGRVMTTGHASCGIIKIWHGSCFREGVCRTKVEGTKSSLYKRVRYWSCTPNDLKAWQKCSRKGDWLGMEVTYPSAAQSSKKSQ
ncbi:hypothetical protein YC2023_082588 [Brassica napus]